MRSRWNQVPVSPVSLIRLSSLYFKDSRAAKVSLNARAEPGWPVERPWHRDIVTAHSNTNRGVSFKSKFHLMWHVPSQQEPGSTVSFLYIVHSVSVCAARACGGLAVGTLSVSTSPAFAFSFPSLSPTTFLLRPHESWKCLSALMCLQDPAAALISSSSSAGGVSERCTSKVRGQVDLGRKGHCTL